MIAIQNLVKQYGSFTAVDGVSLEVASGEIHGFLGPNGAGKTTTIRMIAGLLKPTAGRILVNGHDLSAEPELAKASLGFIPDRPFIYEKLTAGEFLRFHAGLYGLDDGQVNGRVREMLDLFELGRWEHELVESFSHGMKQRLVMSAAFMHRPRAVLVDEPTGRSRSARRAADQGRLPPHERSRRRDPDEHAHARSGAGDVRSDQHHPEGADHRARYGRRAAREPRRASDGSVPAADRRQRTAGDR
jgi:ABC-type Fe3+/spermidine/putrescine transport system ATPase subunit